MPAHHPKKDSEIGIEKMKYGIEKFTVKMKSKSVWDATAANERFCEMAAATPQTILWEIERLSPAGTLVEAATSQSRLGVVCYSRTIRTEKTDNLDQ